MVRRFGYSWVLQQHLDIVRKQIQTETLSVLPASFCGATEDFHAIERWLRFGTVKSEPALITGIADRWVVFPPFCAPDLYDRLPHKLDGADCVMECHSSIARPANHHRGPMGVAYEDRLVIAPDGFFDNDTFGLHHIAKNGFDVHLEPAHLLLAAAVNSIVVAVENLTIGSTVRCRLRA